jgi:hypothetical protein
MPPFAARHYEQTPLNEDEKQLRERASELTRSLGYRMRQTVVDLLEGVAPEGLHRIGIYSADGQPENERTRAWVQEKPSNFAGTLTLVLDRVVKHQDGSVEPVPDSKIDLFTLGMTGLYIPGVDHLAIGDRVAFLEDAMSTMNEIEKDETTKAQEYDTWLNSFSGEK